MAKVSIVLVSYNTKELTHECIKSIYEKTEDVDFDLWVVDNASHDSSQEVIRSEFPQVKLIENNENIGFGRANNLAMAQIKSDYIFLLNTDTILLNNAVKILLDYMDLPENTNVGACGGQLFNPDMTYQTSIGEFDKTENLERKAWGINFHKIKHRLLNTFDKKINHQHGYEKYFSNISKEVDYVIGADLMLRKSVIDRIGGFDERFFMSSEEAELQFRIRKAGYSVIFVPNSQIMHYGGASSYNANKQLKVEKMLMDGTMLFYKACYGEETAKKAKMYYIIYHLRYFILRLFSPKEFRRLMTAIRVKV